jgi:hypothetical protein
MRDTEIVGCDAQNGSLEQGDQGTLKYIFQMFFLDI